MGIEVWAQAVLNGLMSGWIYVLIAVGLTLVLSIAGIMQMAHGEMYMLGGYFVYYFVSSFGLHFLVALVLSAAVVGVLGVIIERVLYRPFRHGDFLPMVIVAIGLMIFLQNSTVLGFGSSQKVVKSPFPGVLNVAGLIMSYERLVIIAVSVVFVAGLLYFIHRTKSGQAMLAVSQDLDAAALQGIDANRVSSIAMFLGCAMAAIAGGLMGAVFALSPYMGGFALMKGIAVIILGGLGSITGALVGGLILGMIDGVVPAFLNLHMASLAGFLIIIITLVFRPEGILGRPEK